MRDDVGAYIAALRAAQAVDGAARHPGLAVGCLVLTVEDATLRGPVGAERLPEHVRIVAERLMRRPGVLVPFGALIEAMYGDRGRDEPENAETVLRVNVVSLRAMVGRLSAGQVRVRTERGVGYAMERVT